MSVSEPLAQQNYHHLLFYRQCEVSLSEGQMVRDRVWCIDVNIKAAMVMYIIIHK